MENICHLNRKNIKTEGAIMISDKVNFKAKSIIRKKQTFCNDKRINLSTMFKNSKYDCTEHTASKYMKPKLTKIKGEIGKSTITLHS